MCIRDRQHVVAAGCNMLLPRVVIFKRSYVYICVYMCFFLISPPPSPDNPQQAGENPLPKKTGHMLQCPTNALVPRAASVCRARTERVRGCSKLGRFLSVLGHPAIAGEERRACHGCCAKPSRRHCAQPSRDCHCAPPSRCHSPQPSRDCHLLGAARHCPQPSRDCRCATPSR